MDNELKDKLDAFIKDFLSVKEVRQYLLLKKQIEESNEIKELENSLRKAQKDMALSFGKTDYEEKKNNYLKIKNDYDTNPLVVNYNVMIEEVKILISELENKIKQ